MFVMTLLVIASCTQTKKEAKDETAKDSSKVETKNEPKTPVVYKGFDKSYIGKIGDKKEIRANIRRYGDKISGTYWLVANGKDLVLDGTIKDETFELNELDSTGNKVAVITGTLSEKDTKISGEWVKGEEKRTMELTEAKPMTPSQWKLDQKEIDNHSKTGECYIHVSYPQFKNLSDLKMQTKVNALIEEHFPIHEMEASLLNCKESFRDDINYEVSYLRGDLMSVTKIHHLVKNGNPYPGESWGININFHTGKVYELRDFFKPDLIPDLNKMLTGKINDACGGTLTEEQLKKLELKPTNIEGFSLTDNKTFRKKTEKDGKLVVKEKITREGKVIFHLTDRLPKGLKSSGYVKLFYHDIKKFVNPNSLLMHVITRYEKQMERQRKEALSSN